MGTTARPERPWPRIPPAGLESPSTPSSRLLHRATTAGPHPLAAPTDLPPARSRPPRTLSPSASHPVPLPRAVPSSLPRRPRPHPSRPLRAAEPRYASAVTRSNPQSRPLCHRAHLTDIARTRRSGRAPRSRTSVAVPTRTWRAVKWRRGFEAFTGGGDRRSRSRRRRRGPSAQRLRARSSAAAAAPAPGFSVQRSVFRSNGK